VQDRRAYVADIIRNKSPKLLGKLLRQLIKKAGITQNELEAKSLTYLDLWSEQGYFAKADAGDLTQPVISRVLNGRFIPRYGQLCMWLYALEDILRARDLESEFPPDLKEDMFRLAWRGLPSEVVAAYERRKDMVLPKEPKR
jgi:transcriptional regulator with XRE-family HTH domain